MTILGMLATVFGFVCLIFGIGLFCAGDDDNAAWTSGGMVFVILGLVMFGTAYWELSCHA
jgi:hypothetical protein